MTRKQFFEITEWQDETFPNSTELSRVKHLMYEVEELKDVILSLGSEEEKRMEYADCLFLLFGAAKKSGLDYNDIIGLIDKKFKINKQRSWGKSDSDSVVFHIKS